MTDLISGTVLTTLAQVVLIDLVFAGDNAVVIGLAAACHNEERCDYVGQIAVSFVHMLGGGMLELRTDPNQ